MIKRWKRRAKLIATSIIIVGYVTLGLFNAAISRNGSKVGEDPVGESSTVKTIIGYSMEFRMREEMMTEELACEERPAEDSFPEKSAYPWKRDENLRLFLFSAYYDTRLEPYHYVRIIGLFPRNVPLYCQVRLCHHRVHLRLQRPGNLGLPCPYTRDLTLLETDPYHHL